MNMENVKEFKDLVSEYKNGNESAFDEMLNVVYYNYDEENQTGIKKIYIKDKELVKNYSHFMKLKRYDKLDYSNKMSIFFEGFIEALNNIQTYDNNKQVLAYFNNTIENKFNYYVAREMDYLPLITTGFDKDFPDLKGELDDDPVLFNTHWQASYKISGFDIIDEPLSDAELFLAQNDVKDFLNESQKELLDNFYKTNVEIANEKGVTPQAISQQKIKIKNTLLDKYEAFKELNKRYTTRLTGNILDYLDHIDRVSRFYHLNDELMFHDIFHFVKTEYIRSNNNKLYDEIKDIHNMHKNKEVTKDTIIDILANGIPVQKMIKLQAMLSDKQFWGKPKEIGEEVQQYTYNDKKVYITEKEKRTYAKYILKALYNYINTYKKDIENHVKMKRLEEEKNLYKNNKFSQKLA
ncbi:hypothetical protein [Schinkia azotoformans]|uniref:hypothetical protein n=1 Tax=Schinkia azotoformans TaxID=1454 RepID=UPI002DB78072|nr:hypothetical protein [Schinkia azotoformans]MEC1715918.1 hypothetical protein [Schinkia azotoformans]MEC1741557.1 hypothetical protein [Schinkia azotoformans]MEC1744551.1 hypothetical protein [Schinkia azotoformans]MEC1758458.1 hypothetical protein [Schinkia azotoformans]MEC1765260.1 hypothetical protein [Schinkia azotoformans]